MALTLDQIDDLAEEGVFLGNVYEIARAIEAEVRKQDDALIRQLVEALTACRANGAVDGFEFDMATRAITAGRAWLEGKTCA